MDELFEKDGPLFGMDKSLLDIEESAKEKREKDEELRKTKLAQEIFHDFEDRRERRRSQEISHVNWKELTCRFLRSCL